MTSVTVHPTDPISTTITHIPLPQSLAPNDVLIQVHAAASNPKDWLHVRLTGKALNSGDDLAGTVAQVGSNVSRFRVGDRVAAFHPMGQPFGAYAEYAVAPAHTVFQIPQSMSFDEASTIPLVSLTAALTLFQRQRFAAPWFSDTKPHNSRPLIVYAASTALGTYAIKLAKLAGIGPIFAIGGGNSQYVKSILGHEDVVLDYRSGMDQVKRDIAEVMRSRGLSVHNAIDAISERGSWIHVSQMLTDGKLSVFSSADTYDDAAIPSNVEIIYTFVGSGHAGAYPPGMPKQPPADEVKGDVEFAVQFYRWLEDTLQEGQFEGHPFEIIPAGLQGVAEGLKLLKEGQAAGKKFVYHVVDC